MCSRCGIGLVGIILISASISRAESPGLPVAHLAGAVELPQPLSPPKALELRLIPPPPPPGKTKPALGEVSFECPITEGRFNCEVPALELDLRLRIAGYAPEHRWGVGLMAGKTLDLGRIRFTPGASLVGRVESADSLPLADVSVRLMPANAESAGSAVTRERLRRQSHTAQSNERGYFQLRGLAPGEYELLAEKKGLAPLRMAPVEIREGLETQLHDPLVLQPPASVRWTIIPPVDPYGKAWRLKLTPATRAPLAGVEGPVSEEGRWERDGLLPGPQRLALSDADGDRWLALDLNLRSGVNEDVIEVPLVEVRGHVELGGEPFATKLFFTTPGGNRKKVRAASDVDGNLECFLPEEGWWGITVIDREGDLELTLDPKEVRRVPGKSYAEIEIEIPDTRLSGRVVDEKGEPVAGARIEAVTFPSARIPSWVSSGEDGSFRFRGLPEGSYLVTAEAGERESDALPAALDEDLDPPELTLTLRPIRELVGTVRSVGGRPVPGARILLFPELAASPRVAPLDVASGIDGSFRVKLPGDTLFITLLVAPPGHAARLLRSTWPAKGEALEVAVEPAGGLLTVELPPPPAAAGPGRPRSFTQVLFYDGAALPALLLAQFLGQGPAGLGGPPAAFHLNSGTYTLCTGKTAVQAFRQGLPAPEQSCVSGFLPSGGQLTLSAPP